MFVVGTDQQFEDIVCFCANENMAYGSVLGIDPTFNLADFFVTHVSLERVKTMWDKVEQLLSTEGLILPAAGAISTAHQVASLSALKTGKAEAPHYVCSVKHTTGTEVKCDCSVYRSSPNICQHALATAEDLQVLSGYLLWVKRTKKGPNLSQLIASSLPKDGDKNLCHDVTVTLNERSLKISLLLRL